ncbi:MAG: DUF1634 domain-containing protein [Clostridia bacterium]|nr:DUF1634 domain-containing protein [Clostridia bacterium]
MAVADKQKAGEKAYSLEGIVGSILRIGVTGSVVIMLLGLGLLAFRPGPIGVEVLPVAQILSQAIRLRPLALLNLGVLVLLITPLMGVLIATVIFIMQKERLFVIISLTVLAVLFISMLIGSA